MEIICFYNYLKRNILTEKKTKIKSLKDFLQESRLSLIQETRKQRDKRLNVSEGKGISSRDTGYTSSADELEEENCTEEPEESEYSEEERETEIGTEI